MNDTMTELALFLSGLTAGLLASWILNRKRVEKAVEEARSRSASEIAELRERSQRLPPLEEEVRRQRKELDRLLVSEAEKAEALRRLQETHDSARDDLARERKKREDLQESESRLKSEISTLSTRIEEAKKSSEEKLALLQEARESLSAQFRNLAGEILEEKSQRFSQQNQIELNQLLDPLKLKITEFQSKVEDVYVKEGKDRTALATQVTQLMELNRTLSEEAQNLTRALTGSSKTQGNWGELLLDKVLEGSGLRKGIDYETQESHTREDGSRAQPDVVIHLPEERHLVIDSKVSLNAYIDYANAPLETDRDMAVKRHLDSVRRHIGDLSSRKYQNLYSLNSIDFVLMFVPLEPAFMLAVTSDSGLFSDAWERNVLLVSPSTLLFVLRTVAHLWRQEAQSRNAQEIARRGGEFYDRLSAFVADLEKIGERIDQARNSYQDARNKLCQNRGNVIRQAEMLKGLGVNPTKSFPQGMLESAMEEGEIPE
jgi:DNA recombination protein RmuC